MAGRNDVEMGPANSLYASVYSIVSIMKDKLLNYGTNPCNYDPFLFLVKQ